VGIRIGKRQAVRAGNEQRDVCGNGDVRPVQRGLQVERIVLSINFRLLTNALVPTVRRVTAALFTHVRVARNAMSSTVMTVRPNDHALERADAEWRVLDQYSGEESKS
jgi:hypothetical protein